MNPSKDTIWDPLRRKEVALTPEERVRQWFVSVLAGKGVPLHMMGSEVPLRLPEGRTLRSDIVVFGRGGAPAMVVECKRPGVTVDQRVAAQVLRYASALGSRFVVVTNGDETFVFKRGGSGYERLAALPVWEDMANDAD